MTGEKLDEDWREEGKKRQKTGDGRDLGLM